MSSLHLGRRSIQRIREECKKGDLVASVIDLTVDDSEEEL